ncbi:MAG: prepilin-type N-terminal cleavage/methylation domain-containing protein [bacterium]|nr:prepilin-type N-terminal cleavage/methylation domain-containing protein [bacterium]
MNIFLQKIQGTVKQKRNRGFTLIEVIISITFLAMIIVVSLQGLSPSLDSISYTNEYVKINLLINEKCELIRSHGFWTRDIDTANPDFPSNPHDPANKWSADLALLGYEERATINVIFMKEVAGEIVPFDGEEFDGNFPRNKVRVDVTIYTPQYISTKNPLTSSVSLTAYASLKTVKAHLATMRNALEMYAYNNMGDYPLTGNLDALVPSYLVEIPNNPYTEEKNKVTHIEELADWYYENDTLSRVIVLVPESHRGDTDYTETWTY